MLKNAIFRNASILLAKDASMKSAAYECRQGWRRYVLDFFNTLLKLERLKIGDVGVVEEVPSMSF